MSDAGSIRSNRSGVSAIQQQAIRNGAYRVSRLPGDQIFLKDDIANALKPSWKVGSQGSTFTERVVEAFKRAFFFPTLLDDGRNDSSTII